MALPEHVKRQAMDAVANSEIMAQIKLVRDNGSATPPFTPGPDRDAPSDRPISEDVKKQARDVVSPDVREQIRLVAMNGSPVPDETPSSRTDRIAERVAKIQQNGLDAEKNHRDVTRDNFARPYE